MAEVMTGYLRQIIMDQFDAACHVWGVLTRSNMAMDHGEIRTVVCPASFETPRNVEAVILPFGDGRLYLVYSSGERAELGPCWSFIGID